MRISFYVLSFLLVVVLFVSIIGGFFFVKFYKIDIDPILHYKPSLTTQIYDSRDRLIANIFEDEHRLYARFDEFPSRLVEALVAIEDTTFFEHSGINIEAIFRAAFKVVIARKAVEGASTITQQIVKNLVLSRDKTIQRKAKEAVLAMKLERYLTKEEILERYLNEIFFGHGYYGIKTAARGYFRKELNELSLKEIAILVGLPRAPSFYDPTRHKLHALARANTVIRRMYALGWISDDEYEKAIQEDPIAYNDTRTLNKAPYVIDHIISTLKDDFPDLKGGGYVIKTALDLDAQKIAQKSLRYSYKKAYARVEEFLLKDKVGEYREYKKALKSYDSNATTLKEKIALVDAGEDSVSFASRLISNYSFPPDLSVEEILLRFGIKKPIAPKEIDINATESRLNELNGAMVVMAQNTGDILALVGGVDYEKSNFNRATQSKRQLGSSFKPFLYLASFDLGYAPSSLVPDISRTYTFQINKDEEKIWKPSNFEHNFVGIMTEREAVVHSRNLATINLLDGVGLNPIYEKLLGYGFVGLPRDFSIALGAHSMSPLEISKYYSIISNYGQMVEPRLITSVERMGETLKTFDIQKRFSTKPEQAYLMIDVLRDTVNRGTGRNARVWGIEIAGKTGTTNDSKDGLFCGFSPSVQTVVWFGNDNYLQITNTETGGRIAAPAFKMFNSLYLKLHPELVRKFYVPKGVFSVELSNGKKEIFTDISRLPKEKRTIEKKDDIVF